MILRCVKSRAYSGLFRYFLLTYLLTYVLTYLLTGLRPDKYSNS